MNPDIKHFEDGAPNISLPLDRLMALFQFSLRINQINDLQRLLDETLHSAISGIGAERGMIILTDEEGEHYRTLASESLENDLDFSTSIVQATLECRETLMSSDLSSDSRFEKAESVKGLNILSFICVPLMVPGRTQTIGTLYVDQRIHVKTFTEEDAGFLQAFANLAAIAIENANLMEQLMGENLELRHEVQKKYEFSGVIGQSKAMQKLFREMKQVLNDDCTVLITGESGSGKEVIAKAIHYNGNRKDKPFLAINCGALPESLLEAELFGSVRGAFTGAVDKQGLFQAAQGGTLFLDEIHHTSEAMQIKLLRTLQEREIRRVGGTSSTRINARLICATNEDLRKAIQESRFRQDFYYRINVVTLDIPPLRDRREDIPLLVDHFLSKYSKEKGKELKGLDSRTLQALMSYDWSENNIRELENEIERVVIFAANGTRIQLRHLSERFQGAPQYAKISNEFFSREADVPLTFEEFEKKYIRFILDRAGGNKAKAAQIMQIPRSTLRGKIRKLGLNE
jgi:Nif-specific regulatory protein